MLKPSLALLMKLGSIAVHADELHPNQDEMILTQAQHLDIVALRSLLDDPEVVAWLEQMDAEAFLPKKRTTPTRRQK